MAETAKKTHVQTALKHKWNPMHNMANDFHKKQPTISLGPEGPGAIAPGPSGHRDGDMLPNPVCRPYKLFVCHDGTSRKKRQHKGCHWANSRPPWNKLNISRSRH